MDVDAVWQVTPSITPLPATVVDCVVSTTFSDWSACFASACSATDGVQSRYTVLIVELMFELIHVTVLNFVFDSGTARS